VHKLELSERTYECPACGNKIGRDLNAAINILRAGTAQYAFGESSKYVEKLHVLTILAELNAEGSSVL